MQGGSPDDADVAVVLVVVALVAVGVVVVVVAVGAALVAVVAGCEPAVEVDPLEAAGVPLELPHAVSVIAATASSGRIRFMQRCSAIDLDGPPLFSPDP